MKNNTGKPDYSSLQIFGLTALRVFIGWHFLYEGLYKVISPDWTAYWYLSNSVGPASGVFKMMADNNTILRIVDYLNMWGLVIMGLGLFLGLFARYCKVFGIILLILYYIAYPPFAAFSIESTVEGNYWVVNKVLLEMAAIFILLLFPSSHVTGLDVFLLKRKSDQIS
jgi:thiosulfate dehydrogenase [quinone] large subunit